MCALCLEVSNHAYFWTEAREMCLKMYNLKITLTSHTNWQKAQMSMHAFQTSRCRHNLICAYQPIIIAFMSSTNVFFIWITPNKPSFTGRKILEGDLLNVKVNQASNIKLPAAFMYINVKPCDLFKEQVRFSLIIFVWMVWERDTAKIYVCAIHAKVRLGLSEPLSVQSVHSLHAGFPTQVSSNFNKGPLVQSSECQEMKYWKCWT